MALYDRVRFTTATTGTGTITVGTAVVGYQTPASAGVPNAGTFPYVIVDGTDWETGEGTYDSGATTVARSLIDSSSGSLLNLSGSAEMFITTLTSTFGTAAFINTGTSGATIPLLSQVNTFTGRQDFTGTIRSTAKANFASGVGIEVYWDTASSHGVVIAYNRGTSAYQPLLFEGSSIDLNVAGSGTIVEINTTGANLGSGKTLSVNGTQVLTSRRTGWGAPTGTATRSTFATGTVTTAQLAARVKALIDDLTTHGVIGS